MLGLIFFDRKDLILYQHLRNDDISLVHVNSRSFKTLLRNLIVSIYETFRQTKRLIFFTSLQLKYLQSIYLSQWISVSTIMAQNLSVKRFLTTIDQSLKIYIKNRLAKMSIPTQIYAVANSRF